MTRALIIASIIILDAALWIVGIALDATVMLAAAGFALLAIVQIWRVAARVGGER